MILHYWDVGGFEVLEADPQEGLMKQYAGL